MKNTFYLLGMLSLTACNPYPLGMDQAQWNNLTAAQQHAAMQQQHQQNLIQQQQAELARQQQEEAQLHFERQRLESGVRQRLGITEAEWSQIPPDKRLNLRQEQNAIERQSNMMAQTANANNVANNQIASATQNIAYAIHEDSHRTLYTNAAYGSVVNCEISGGNAKFSTGGWGDGKWSALMPVRFSIAKGDSKDIEIRRLDKQRFSNSFWVTFTENQELEFCADENTEQRYKRCRTHPVSQAFRDGYNAPLSIPNSIDGATMNCSFAPGRM